MSLSVVVVLYSSTVMLISICSYLQFLLCNDEFEEDSKMFICLLCLVLVFQQQTLITNKYFKRTDTPRKIINYYIVHGVNDYI